MSPRGDTEPFPLLSAAAAADRQLASEMSAAARRRRKSSGLGSDLRVGDTGAPALATSLAHLNGSHKVRRYSLGGGIRKCCEPTR